MGRLVVMLAGILAAGGPAVLAAQNSVYAVRGIGFPGRPLSARARALGGGPAVFDPVSAVNPAAATAFSRLTVIAVSGTEYRTYKIGDTRVEGLRATRFPLALIGGAITRRVHYAFSFASYAERTFDVISADTVPLRGEQVAVEDRLSSNGGIVDLRGAVAWTPARRIWVGAAIHLISGSAKLVVRREFGDSAFRSFQRTGKASFSGTGVSAGAIVTVAPGFRIGVTGRIDGTLEQAVDSVPAGRVNLPVTLSAGIELAPLPALRVTATAAWRSWSDAAPDLVAPDESAFDTWEVGTGIELGAAGTSRIPLRLGFRYAQLPFAPGSEQAREIDLALGTGLVFASNRGLVDFTLERALRDGAGVSERAWQISVSMTVRP